MSVVAIVGSRGYENLSAVERYVRFDVNVGDTVISGGARGVDSTAVDTARSRRGLAAPVVIKPDYDTYGRYLAPKIRNREIAVKCDRMVAFWDGSSGGTAHAVCCAVSLGKPVEVVLGGDAASATA